MKKESFGVGIIGLNHGVKLLLPTLIRSNRVSSISLAGSNSSIGKKVSLQNHEFMVENSDELITSQKAQAIFVCTPPSTHFELVSKALSLGKFVYCEKPGGLNSNELMEVNRLSKQSRKPVIIGYEYRFDPFIVFLKKYMEEIDISRLKLIKIDWETSGALNQNRKIWKQVAGKGGEVHRDFLPHVIDYLKYSIPRVFEDYIENEITVEKAEIDHDQIQLHFKLKSVEFEISISRNRTYPIGHRIRILGKDLDVEVLRTQPYSLKAGQVFINGHLIDVRDSKDIRKEIADIESEVTFRENLQMYATDVLVENFLLSCSDGDFSRAPSIQDALENMQMIDFIISQSNTSIRE